jgi:hypothetical protein
VIVLVVALLLVAVAVAAYRFSLTFEPRHRVAYWIVVALAAAYFMPSLVRSGLDGYRKGAEFRQQQGR